MKGVYLASIRSRAVLVSPLLTVCDCENLLIYSLNNHTERATAPVMANSVKANIINVIMVSI